MRFYTLLLCILFHLFVFLVFMLFGSHALHVCLNALWSSEDEWLCGGRGGQSRASRVQLSVHEEWPVQKWSSILQWWTWTLRHKVRELITNSFSVAVMLYVNLFFMITVSTWCFEMVPEFSQSIWDTNNKINNLSRLPLSLCDSCQSARKVVI